MFAIVPLLARPWSKDRTNAPLVPPALRERIGPPLAEWLVATRLLRARLLDLELEIKTVGAREIERKKAGLVRPVAFEITDANLYQEIQEVQSMSARWVEQGRQLRAEASSALNLEFDIDEEELVIPWSIELGQRSDRIPELQAALKRCREALATLQRVDDALSEPRPRGD